MSYITFLIFVGIFFQQNIAGPAENQLLLWAKTHQKVPATNDHYSHVSSLTGTLSVGPKGPLLLADPNSQGQLAAFVRERIPERFYHASAGAGAKGYFKVTKDMSRFTRAKIFHTVGQRTPVVVRFSTSTGNLGAPDTLQDPRGIAIKFKTKDGNYDLLMENTEVYPIRDPILFPSMMRSRRRNPATNLLDYDAFHDFITLRPEASLHYLQSSKLPRNYRYVDGHSINTFTWETGGDTRKSNYHSVYIRYHLLTRQKGKKALSLKTARRLAGSDPDHVMRDLYNSIANKNYPSWTVAIQMFTTEDVEKASFDLFDPTKMLFKKEFPLIKIGKLVLTQNPIDYFNDVEQTAFNPANLIPGIILSPDRLLQGRGFAYLHAHYHRIGPNFYQLPINGPAPGVKGHSYLKDGFMNINGNGDGGPNYFPNSFNGPYVDPKAASPVKVKIQGGIVEAVDVTGNDNLDQIDRYWREYLSPAQKQAAIHLMATDLSKCSEKIRNRALDEIWIPASAELGKRLKEELAKIKKTRQRIKEEIPKNNNSTKPTSK